MKLTLFVLLLTPLPLLAQAADPQQHPGVFRPVTNPAVDLSNALPPQRQAAMANLNQVIAALKHTPAITNPVGYDVQLSRALHFDSRTSPVAGGISGLILLYYSDEDSGKIIAGAEGPGFSINLNEPFSCIFADYNQPYMEDDDGRVFFQPQSDGKDHGWPHYEMGADGGCTLMSNITRPLWLPVSRERVLKSVIAKKRESVQEVRDLVARIKGSLPGGVPADVAAQLKKLDSDLRALEAEFAALSPAERAAQAFFWPESTGLTPIVGAGHSGATGLVTPNPAYISRTAPPSQIQTLSLRMDMPETYQWYTPFKGEVFGRIRDGMDWSLLAGLLGK